MSKFKSAVTKQIFLEKVGEIQMNFPSKKSISSIVEHQLHFKCVP